MEFSRTLKHHYKPKAGWINDPNGLSYFKGYYHLFYQCAPHHEDPFVEPMHWGHCITKDFNTFEELEPALIPEYPYETDGCWSGSAIVKDDVLYLFYTSVVSEEGKRFSKQTVSVAYSKDGIHFEKYLDNPIIRTYPSDGSSDFRDPAIIKNNDTYYLVMATGNPEAKKARLVYYESSDLFHWEYRDIISEWDNKKFCECPSFVKYDEKYLLSTSVCGYDDSHFFLLMYGDFNNNKFTPLLTTQFNKGPDQYAGQIFLDNKNRHILISWITGWHFEKFNEFSLGCLSTPLEIKVKDNKISAWPIEECQHLLKDDDEAIIHTTDGFVIKRQAKDDFVYKGKIENMKVIRDEYVLEIYLNNGEEIYTIILC